MSLMGNLALEAEEMAGTSYLGSSSSRAARALEFLCNGTTSGSLATRISEACRKLVLNEGKTPVAQNQTPFVEAAGNLEVWSGLSNVASPITRMIAVLKAGNDFISDSIVVGKDIAVTNTRAGKRGSAFVGGSDSLANTADTVTIAGLPVYFAAVAQTNLVSTDFSKWSKGANSTFTDLGNGIARLTMPLASATYFNYAISTDDTSHTVAFDIRNSPDSVQSGSVAVQSRSATLIQEYYSAIPPTEWTTIYATKDTNSSATDLYIIDSGGVDVEIRNFRYVKSTAPVPPFVDGTVAGEACAVDDLTCSPTFGSVGTIIQWFKPYGWTTTSPSGQVAYTWAHFPPPFSILASAIGGNIIAYPITKTSTVPMDGVAKVSRYDWNGTEIGFAVDNETRQTGAEITTPSGPLYLGNSNNGNRPLHGAVVTLVSNIVETDPRFEVGRVTIRAKLNTFQFQ